MAVKKIEFEDKVSTIESSLPAINRIRDVDVNEIKDVVNNNADELIAMQFETISDNDITLNYGSLSANVCFKQGRAVSLNISITGLTHNSGTIEFLTIGSKYRPSSACYILAYVNGVWQNAWLNTDGVLKVSLSSNVTGAEVKILTTYYV
jgi:hypothetical protein